jgi:5'-nucleotidase
MESVLGHIQTDMDGEFTTIRRKESNLGNFICDIVLEVRVYLYANLTRMIQTFCFFKSINADVCIINSGTLRSDCIHRAGPFKMRDLKKILPFPDPVIMLRVSGRILHEVLENGVSQYPKLEGRFPQVGGIQFEFDPSRRPGDRVDLNSIKIQGEPLDYERDYNLATKMYLKEGLASFLIY